MKKFNIDTKTYLNAAMVGVTQFVGFLVAGSLVSALGNKTISIIVLTIAGVVGISLYWATSSFVTVILSSIFVAVSDISATAMLGVVAILFPTTLRTVIVSLVLTFGRIGALIGNTVFPVLMGLGCLPPFMMIGGTMFVAAFLSLFLPRGINKKALS